MQCLWLNVNLPDGIYTGHMNMEATRYSHKELESFLWCGFCWRTMRETSGYFRYHSFIYIWTKLYRLCNHSFHFLFSSVLYCETEVLTHHTFLSYFILIPSHVPSIC